VDEAEQDVLGADVVVIEHSGLVLSQNHNTPCPVSKPLEHRPPPRAAEQNLAARPEHRPDGTCPGTPVMTHPRYAPAASAKAMRDRGAVRHLHLVQVRVAPLATLMTSTLPYSAPGDGNSSTRDSASILPSGDSAAPITGTPRLSKFSWLSSPGRPSGDTVSRNKVTSATPGKSPPRETTITKCRPSAPAKGSPLTGDRGFPAATGIETEPATCPSPEARTTTSSPATTR